MPGYQDHHSIPTLRRKVRRTLHEFLIPASVSFCYSRPPRVENPDFVFFREEQLGAVTQVTCRFNFVHESIGDGKKNTMAENEGALSRDKLL